jgi:hypothetical protein
MISVISRVAQVGERRDLWDFIPEVPVRPWSLESVPEQQNMSISSKTSEAERAGALSVTSCQVPAPAATYAGESLSA